MNYIKKHKLTSFVILVYIVVVAFAYFIYKLFIGSSGLPVYGDRLDGIESVPITEEQKDKIVEAFTSDRYVLNITRPYLNGKILKVVVTTADNASLPGAKEISSRILEALDADQKAFYDIEYFVTKRYNCTLEATGRMDEEGNFLSDVEVKFVDDLKDNKYGIDYGLSTTANVEYNKEQNYTIKEDGEYIIYGKTKDVSGESSCSIKIVRKASDAESKLTTVNTVTVDREFPTIGYMKAGTSGYVWAKTT